MVKSKQLINLVIVLAVLYVVFKTGILNSIIAGLKNVGNQIGSGIGGGGGSGGGGSSGGTSGGGGGSGGGSGNVYASGQETATAGGNTGRTTDVSGDGCACSNQNGVMECKGNCSSGAQIDLENFDPFRFVQENT